MNPAQALKPLGHPGTYGPAYGRYTPFQTEASEMRMLAEVAQDVIATDDAGIDYPAGQLWVRTYGKLLDKATGDYDSDYYWCAVPSSLPAGYTATPWRNNVGAGGFGFDLIGAFQLDDGFSPQMFYPNYQPSKPIRLADGPYTPFCTTMNPTTGNKDFIAGPCNMRGAVGSYDFGRTFGGFSGLHFSYHPGYRNVRINLFLFAADYAAAAGGSTITVTLEGTGYTASKADFVLSGSDYRFHIDTGPIAQAAAGAVQRMSIDCATSGLSAAFMSIAASPRIDIPAPFWASSGNLIAPGGLAAGTVPGF